MRINKVSTIYIVVLIISFAFFLNGCAKMQPLMTLKKFGDNQAQIKKYLEKQEALFDKLIEDVRGNQIKIGTSKRVFMISYGDPVVIRPHEETGEELIYRHPTNYFSSDKVYVYFDKGKKLIRFVYKPYEKPDQKES
jgi:hypothetical protein